MAQVIIRNLDPEVVRALKERAAVNGHSLEQELRNLLVAAATPTPAERCAIAEKIRAMTKGPIDVDIEALIRADRDRCHW